MTWAVAAVLVSVGVDPMTAYGIGGFTSSLAFGGNGKENITSGVMAAATFKIGHSGFSDETRYFLHGALTATNSSINGGDPMLGFIQGTFSAVSNTQIMGVKTGNGFTDFAVRTTLGAMVGGTTNAAMGGSFAEGARNGARIMLMNEMGAIVKDQILEFGKGLSELIESKYFKSSVLGKAYVGSDYAQLSVDAANITIQRGLNDIDFFMQTGGLHYPSPQGSAIDWRKVNWSPYIRPNNTSLDVMKKFFNSISQ